MDLDDPDDPDDPAVVSMSCLVGSRYLERPEQVERYRDAAGTLRRQSVPVKEYLRERPDLPDRGLQLPG